MRKSDARSSAVAPRRSRFMTVTPGVAVDWVAWTAPRRFGERSAPVNRAQARRRAKPRTGLSDSHRLRIQDSIELMRTNTTRERLAKGEGVYGCGLQVYRAPEISRAFAAAGFAYVFIDMEHGSFNLETAHDMIIACKLAGITPIVRVGEVRYTLCARLLDQGAQGIILPRVEDPEVLAEALGWLRFPPLGIRGFGINPTMVDYEACTMPEIIEHQNRETLSVVQFETVRAVERADELLSLKGLDVVMIGPADLSISLGIPGQFDNPLLIRTVDKVIERCNAHGVVPGIQTRGIAMAKMWAERGMRFVGVAAEHVFLLEKCKEAIATLRAAKEKRPCGTGGGAALRRDDSEFDRSVKLLGESLRRAGASAKLAPGASALPRSSPSKGVI